MPESNKNQLKTPPEKRSGKALEVTQEADRFRDDRDEQYILQSNKSPDDFE